MGIIHLPAGKTALASACGERFDPQQVCFADGPVTWEFTLVSNNAQYALWASTCPNTIPGTGGYCGTTPGGYRNPNGPDIDNQTLNAQLFSWGALNSFSNSVRSFQYSGASTFQMLQIQLTSVGEAIGTAAGPDFIIPASPPFVPQRTYQGFSPATGVGSLPTYEAAGTETYIRTITTSTPRVQIRLNKAVGVDPSPLNFAIYPGGGLTYLSPGDVIAPTGFAARPIDVALTGFGSDYEITAGDWLEFRFYSSGPALEEAPQVQFGDIDVTVTGFVA